MYISKITLASGGTAPAATYARTLLDGGTKYGIDVTGSGRYLKKTAVADTAPSAGSPDRAY